MPKYLVAVDFSECSRNVLDHAIQRCVKDGADMLLVHAFHKGLRLGQIYQDRATDPIQALEAEMRLDEAVEFTGEWAEKARHAGVKVDTLAKEVDATELILESAKEDDVEMIIMGRSGHGVLHQLFVGSTADYIIRSSPVPVLVIPEKKG